MGASAQGLANEGVAACGAEQSRAVADGEDYAVRLLGRWKKRKVNLHRCTLFGFTM